MARRSDHSRPELESLIVAAGIAHLAEVGFARFSAREVAKRVGYSIGTIYNVWGSYDRLILAINTRTLTEWTAALQARLEAADADRIAALVDGYFDFAAVNTNRWLALYDHRMAPDELLPDWFNHAFGGLLALVEGEVATALGRAPDPATRALTGSLLAVAHGHCTFALNGLYRSFDADPRAAALTRIREALGTAAE